MQEPDKNDLSIDEQELDRECARQSNLYYDAAHDLAEARRDLDLAKDKLELIRAELDGEIRSNPTLFGLEKATEASIEACILRQSRYRQASNSVLNAKFSCEILAAFVTALDHKKKSLENMVQLHGQNYFSTPRVSGGLKQDISERERRRAFTHKTKRLED